MVSVIVVFINIVMIITQSPGEKDTHFPGFGS